MPKDVPQPSYMTTQRPATPMPDAEILPNGRRPDMNEQKKCWAQEKIGGTERWAADQATLAALTKTQQEQALCMLIAEARRLYLTTNKTPENSRRLREVNALFATLLRNIRNIGASSQSPHKIREQFCSYGLFQPCPRVDALIDALVRETANNRSGPSQANDATATPPPTPRNGS